LLLLGKKGKVVSAVVNNLEHRNIAVGMSFNLLNYETPRQIVSVENKLFVLEKSLLNVFTVDTNANAYRHYNFYPVNGASSFFVRTIPA
jgi:hypothetical protein